MPGWERPSFPGCASLKNGEISFLAAEDIHIARSRPPPMLFQRNIHHETRPDQEQEHKKYRFRPVWRQVSNPEGRKKDTKGNTGKENGRKCSILVQKRPERIILISPSDSGRVEEPLNLYIAVSDPPDNRQAPKHYERYQEIKQYLPLHSVRTKMWFAIRSITQLSALIHRKRRCMQHAHRRDCSDHPTSAP